MDWYKINNIEQVDTPALLVYPDRVLANIQGQLARAKGKEWLRPHVKTNKMAAVCQLMLQEGIARFKCATIAEAEMLGEVEAPDVLLAYPVLGPKISRLIQLIQKYPKTRYSCLVDDDGVAEQLSIAAGQQGMVLEVWIDVNVGMNRTGIIPSKLASLYGKLSSLNGLHIVGLHAYDGHLHDVDVLARRTKCDAAFAPLWVELEKLNAVLDQPLAVVAGGTPTFPIHNERPQVQASPGTFVFWDWGYQHGLPEQAFDFAALVATRVISIIDGHTICTDLGHKSIAAENPLPRVHFLNAAEARPTAQSEEHLVLSVADSGAYQLGDVLYGVPVHICPTVALYETAVVVHAGQAMDEWSIARDKKISC